MRRAPEEILREIETPLTRRGEYVREFKQSHRREDDIAIVTACMRVRFRVGEEGEEARARGRSRARARGRSRARARGRVGRGQGRSRRGEGKESTSDASPTVAEIRLAFGGMSFKTVTCPKTEAALVGEPWCDATLRRALETLPEDLPMASDVPGGAPGTDRRWRVPSFSSFRALRATTRRGRSRASRRENRRAPPGGRLRVRSIPSLAPRRRAVLRGDARGAPRRPTDETPIGGGARDGRGGVLRRRSQTRGDAPRRARPLHGGPRGRRRGGFRGRARHARRSRVLRPPRRPRERYRTGGD